MKTKAIKLYESGPPKKMIWENISLPKVTKDEVLVEHKYVGFNMIDTYHRSGIYPTPLKPCGLGTEAAGVVKEIGDEVKSLRVGDQIAYAGSGSGLGAYSFKRILKESDLIKLPDYIDMKMAAALLTKGRTVEYLFNRTHKLRNNEVVLFHAAAGGVGQIAGQWANSIGAISIGIVGSRNKEQYAKKSGYNYVFNLEDHDVTKEVMNITNQNGVDVVYDSVGYSTWDISLKCVKKLGLVVSFGSASGNPPLYDIAKDGVKNSAYIHRATMVNYMTTSKIASESANVVFNKVKDGCIKLNLNLDYNLDDVVNVHIDAEARKTTGQIVMKV